MEMTRSEKKTPGIDSISCLGMIKVKLLESHHDCVSAAHPGRDRTYSRLARSFYWPGMAKDVKRYVK